MANYIEKECWLLRKSMHQQDSVSIKMNLWNILARLHDCFDVVDSIGFFSRIALSREKNAVSLTSQTAARCKEKNTKYFHRTEAAASGTWLSCIHTGKKVSRSIQIIFSLKLQTTNRSGEKLLLQLWFHFDWKLNFRNPDWSATITRRKPSRALETGSCHLGEVKNSLQIRTTEVWSFIFGRSDFKSVVRLVQTATSAVGPHAELFPNKIWSRITSTHRFFAECMFVQCSFWFWPRNCVSYDHM